MKNITEFLNESMIVNEAMNIKRDQLVDNIIELTSEWGYDCDVKDFNNLMKKLPANVKFNNFITMDDDEEVIDQYNNYVGDAKQLGHASSYNITVDVFQSQHTGLYIIGVSDDNDGFAMTIGRKF